MAIFTIDKFTGGDIGARASYFERGEGQVLGDEHDQVLSTGGRTTTTSPAPTRCWPSISVKVPRQ